MGKIRLFVLVMAVAFLAAACAEMEEFEFRPIDEIPAGEGIVTGKSGEWTIYKQ